MSDVTSDVSIALLRGLNVGGHGKLPMAELRQLLANLGARDVKTYIQSGNAVFRGALDPAAISDAIEAVKGFRPACIVLRQSELTDAIAANPFAEAEATPKTLHLFFLSEPSSAGPAELRAKDAATEDFLLSKRVLFLHSPKGLSASKLATGLDRKLGVAVTGRNWNTVTKLAELAKSL